MQGQMIFTFLFTAGWRKIIGKNFNFFLVVKCNKHKRFVPSCNSDDLQGLVPGRLIKLESKVPECYGAFHHF